MTRATLLLVGLTPALLLACGGDSGAGRLAPAASPSTALGVSPPSSRGTVASSPRVHGPGATPLAGARAVGDAYRALQRLESYRLTLDVSGFDVAGLRGDLRVRYTVRAGSGGGDLFVQATENGQPALEGYIMGHRVYLARPGGGFRETSATEAAAVSLQTLADLPKSLLTNLTPASATYVLVGRERRGGVETRRFDGAVSLTSLSFVDRALARQLGRAESRFWIAERGAYLVAATGAIQPATGSPARFALAVADVGQIAPFAPPP